MILCTPIYTLVPDRTLGIFGIIFHVLAANGCEEQRCVHVCHWSVRHPRNCRWLTMKFFIRDGCRMPCSSFWPYQEVCCDGLQPAYVRQPTKCRRLLPLHNRSGQSSLNTCGALR